MKPPCGVFFRAPGTLELNVTEALPMSRSRNEPERAPRRRRRHRPAARVQPREMSPPAHEPALPTEPAFPGEPALPGEPDHTEIDESLLSREERAYVEAKRLAEEKVRFYREAVKLGLVVVPLLIFLPVVGAIVLFFGGVKLGRRFYRTVIEPGLRERLIREEVSKRVEFKVTRERESLEGRHARSLEELSASIAHEIRNPITAAKSLVQQMGEDPGASDNVEYANVALGELERVERSISHLLRFARDEDLRRVDVRMADVLESALETFRERSVRGGIEIIRQFDCEGQLLGDPEKLRRVVINLVGNAIDALEEAGVDKPTIEVAMGENLAGTEVWLRIRDNGAGMDPEVAAKVFSPFFTSKDGGTGLGLPITKKLVDAHDGTIEVVSEEGQGAEFVLTFPKRGEAPGASEGERS